MMKYYYLSPFFELKKIFDKAYVEHKFTKQIILIPIEISHRFSDPQSYLFGLDDQVITDLKIHGLFDLFINEQVIIDKNTPYADISNFFILPRNSYLGLSFGNIKEVFESLAIFGVPYNFGNPNIVTSQSNSMIARRYSHKYNLIKSSYLYAPKIKDEQYTFIMGNNIYDLGDIYFNEREDLSAIVQKILSISDRLIKQNNRFVAIGGDHSITYPLLKGVQNNIKDLVCLHIDAHNDLFLTPECHFTDLALSHSSVVGKLIYEGIEVHSIGIRDFVNVDSISYSDHTCYSCYFCNSDIQFLDQIDKIILILSERKVYLTIDIDVLDPRYFNSVTDPLPNGISLETLITAIYRLNSCLNIISLDIVEANLQSENTLDIHSFLNLVTEIIEIYYGKFK